MPQNNLDVLPLVGVLLATHKPSRFIADQIESIKSQEGVRIRIYWGDYESPESEKEYVRGLLGDINFKEYQIYDPGPAANFFFLLKQASEEYIAFSDQDDIWMPNKLVNQVNLLHGNSEIPSLAHSNSEVLFKGKRIIKKSRCQNHDFATLAVTNCCQGCTMMINSAARETILSSLPEGIIWHDWWIGLVMCLTGRLYLSTETEVLYRIHEGNVIGLPKFSKRLRNFLQHPQGQISYQINEAIERFGNLEINDPKSFQHIRNLTSPTMKIRFLSNMSHRSRRDNNLVDFLRRLAWVLKQP